MINDASKHGVKDPDPKLRVKIGFPAFCDEAAPDHA
jgi:hypothetical protein